MEKIDDSPFLKPPLKRKKLLIQGLFFWLFGLFGLPLWHTEPSKKDIESHSQRLTSISSRFEPLKLFDIFCRDPGKNRKETQQNNQVLKGLRERQPTGKSWQFVRGLWDLSFEKHVFHGSHMFAGFQLKKRLLISNT